MNKIFHYGHRVDQIDAPDPAPSKRDPQLVEDAWDAGNLDAPRPLLAQLWEEAVNDPISALGFLLAGVLVLLMVFSGHIAEALK